MSTDRTLSGLPAADPLSPADLVLVTQGGLSKRASVGDLAGAAAADANIREATATTPAADDNSARVPTTEWVRDRVSAAVEGLVAGAPAALDTLEALAAAIGDDAAFAASTAGALTQKADKARTVTGAGLIAGGGDLSANRTLSVSEASEAEALAGTVADKAMTPRRTKAVVDAAASALQDQLDDLATGQASASVVAATWTELAGYATGGRVDGDYGRVIGADAGTHTDPVVGGTVANRGLYRWSASPAGWKRIADLDADGAAASAAAAAAAVEATLEAAATVRLPTGMRTDYMLCQYLFDEGAGDIVQNVLNPGTLDIDLSGPTNPNVTRTSRGVEMKAGLVQTPSLTNLRTFAVLMRTGHSEAAGFLISGGSSSGSGILGNTTPIGWPVHVGNGWGVHAICRQPIAPNAGAGAFELVQGGYVLIFVEYDMAYTTIVGLGGRHSTTTSRCAHAGVRWAAGWTSQLDEDDRQAVYESVSKWAARNGVTLRATDAGKVVDGAIVCGESTADATSQTAGLSALDRAKRYPNVKILPGSNTALWRTSEELVLGENQTATPSYLPAYHGPAVGLALAKRAAAATSQRDLWICQMAQGTTFLTPSNGVAIPNGVPSGSASWNTAEYAFTQGSLFYRLLSHVQRWEQEARLQGVGIDVKLIEFFIGLNDASLVPTLIPDAGTYEEWLQEFYDDLMTYTGLSGVKLHLPRAHPHDPAYNTTTGPVVRQGQSDLAAGNSTVVQIMDTDSLAREADQVHFTAASNKTIAAAGFAWGGL